MRTNHRQTQAARKKTPHNPHDFAVIFFDSFPEVIQQQETIKDLCPSVRQVNVVVRQEGNMDDPEILSIDPKIKLFAGAAWALIHERRQEEGWYPPSRQS